MGDTWDGVRTDVDAVEQAASDVWTGVGRELEKAEHEASDVWSGVRKDVEAVVEAAEAPFGNRKSRKAEEAPAAE